MTDSFNWRGEEGRNIGAHDFGGADYIRALRAEVASGKSPSQARAEVLGWLQNINDLEGGWVHLWQGNKPGAGTPDYPITLMDRIIGAGSPHRDINTEWREYTDNLNVIEDSQNTFTQADLLATRALSYPDEQIASWVEQQEPGVVPGGTDEGAGGVYHTLLQDIRAAYGDPRFDVGRGNVHDFGHLDYAHALSISGNPQQTRRDVLEWLREQPHWLSYNNRPGSPERSGELDEWSLTDRGGGYGLFDRIEGLGHDVGSGARDIGMDWGDQTSDTFDIDDLRATRATGFTDLEISRWLRPEGGESRYLSPTDRPIDEGGSTEGLYASLDIGPQITRNTTTRSTERTRSFGTPTPSSGIDPRVLDRTPLTIEPRQTFKPRSAIGVSTAKRLSKKYKQTTDLARKSLNRS